MSVIVSKDPDELASLAAAEFGRLAKEALRDRGSFSVALSGGSTPLLLYKYLLDSVVDWERVFFYFGDERNVAPDEDASNFKGANKVLFSASQDPRRQYLSMENRARDAPRGCRRLRANASEAVFRPSSV